MSNIQNAVAALLRIDTELCAMRADQELFAGECLINPRADNAVAQILKENNVTAEDISELYNELIAIAPEGEDGSPPEPYYEWLAIADLLYA